MRISMAVGRAMYDVLRIERMNYEDLGNWSLDVPGGPKMHLHFLEEHESKSARRAASISRYPRRTTPSTRDT
jgi:hypothetical protein